MVLQYDKVNSYSAEEHYSWCVLNRSLLPVVVERWKSSKSSGATRRSHRAEADRLGYRHVHGVLHLLPSHRLPNLLAFVSIALPASLNTEPYTGTKHTYAAAEAEQDREEQLDVALAPIVVSHHLVLALVARPAVVAVAHFRL